MGPHSPQFLQARARGFATLPAACLLVACLHAPAVARVLAAPTFSIVAYDSEAAEWGVALASGLVASGGFIPHARAGAGVIVTQGIPDPSLGPSGLILLEHGRSAGETLDSLRSAATDVETRQLAVLDSRGRVAASTGRRVYPWAGQRLGRGYSCQGAWLESGETLSAMARVYEGARGSLSDRLLAALGAVPGSLREEIRLKSAALLVVRTGGGYQGRSDRLVDLRVDAAADPLAELGRAYTAWATTFLPAAHARFGDEARRLHHAADAEREYALAESGFRSAVARAPKDADALNELAWFLATHDRSPEEAVRFAEAAVLARPGDANLLDTLAEAQLRAGSLERAIESAERAVRATGDGAEAYQARLARLKAAREALRARSDSTSTRAR